jgi:hypothetical protein
LIAPGLAPAFPPGHLMLASGRMVDPVGRTRAYDPGAAEGPHAWPEGLDRRAALGGRRGRLAAAAGWVLAELRPEDILDEDLASGLSQEPRYSGACDKHLPVGQHAGHVAGIACALALAAGASPIAALAEAAAGLHHDDGEALGLHDWATPLKRAYSAMLGPILRAQEALARIVEARFGLRRGATGSAIVRRADAMAHALEAGSRMPADPRWPANPWPGLRVRPMSGEAVRLAWLRSSRGLEAALAAGPGPVADAAAAALAAEFPLDPQETPA